jgi:hypothetical protein
MLLHKTERARTALSDTRSGDLSLHHRRILILTDGRRSINDLMAMLGNDILGDIDALMRAGYLATADAQGARGGIAGGITGGLGQRLREAASRLRPSGEESGAAAVQPGIATAATPAPAAPTPLAEMPAGAGATTAAATAPAASRRSLAASKMYVMDLLQMQRDLRIAECRTEIQCAQDETATVVALLDGVRHLMPLVSESMAARILARLDEVLPEPWLPALRALQSELSGKPVLAVNNPGPAASAAA